MNGLKREDVARRQLVCIDFNGVLDTYTGWIDGGNGTEYGPRQGCMEFLQDLYVKYDICVLTAIDPVHVREWLDRHAMSEYIGQISNTKPPAIAYIDDRAIQFQGDYGKVLAQLHNFKPFWMK